MAGTEAARARPSLHLDRQKQAVHDKRKTTAEEGTESDWGGGVHPSHQSRAACLRVCPVPVCELLHGSLPRGEERLLASLCVYRTNRPWARPGLLNRTLNNPAQNISEPSVQPMEVPPAPGPIGPHLPFPPAFLPCRQAPGNCCQGGLGLSLPVCTMIRAHWSLLKMSPPQVHGWLGASRMLRIDLGPNSGCVTAEPRDLENACDFPYL